MDVNLRSALRNETFFLFACFMGNAHVVEELIAAGCSADELNVRVKVDWSLQEMFHD